MEQPELPVLAERILTKTIRGLLFTVSQLQSTRRVPHPTHVSTRDAEKAAAATANAASAAAATYAATSAAATCAATSGCLGIIYTTAVDHGRNNGGYHADAE